MRTIQVRVVCDRCEKAEFYDMPIKLDNFDHRVIGDPGNLNYAGPPGWQMTHTACWCSIECWKQDVEADKKICHTDAQTVADTVAKQLNDWKDWPQYCRDNKIINQYDIRHIAYY